MRLFIIALLVYLAAIFQLAIFPVFIPYLPFNFLLVLLSVLILFRPRWEAFFWSLIIGALLDIVAAPTFSLFILFIPIITLLLTYLIKHFFQNPNITAYLSIIVVLAVGYTVFINIYKVFLLTQSSQGFSFSGILNQEYLPILQNIGLSFLANVFILAPVVYFSFKRLNQLFEYWEQKG